MPTDDEDYRYVTLTYPDKNNQNHNVKIPFTSYGLSLYCVGLANEATIMSLRHDSELLVRIFVRIMAYESSGHTFYTKTQCLARYYYYYYLSVFLFYKPASFSDFVLSDIVVLFPV